ncbi:MAG: hypothetical protein JWN08_309 [Frankiales bacterium]|nr:hypothetical protein [Frankiales bacterium]
MTSATLRTATRRGVAGSAVVLLLALSGAAPAVAQESPAPAPADDVAVPTADPGPQNPNRYSLSASADGMSFQIQNNKLVANITVEVSPVSTGAQVDSAGSSQAFAGLPYAGAIAQTLPGTVNGLSGGATPPIPPIPGFVATRSPGEPSAKQAQGPYLIAADSLETFSKATASAGASADADNPEAQLSSRAEVVAKPDGSVVSFGTAGAQGLAVGPLKILEFSTSEKITETGDGKPVFESATDLGTIQVAGFLIGIDQKGFNILGTPVPLPAAEALKAVNGILGDSGTEVSYLPRTVTRDAVSDRTTVTSGALRITTLQDLPVQGPTKVVYTYGKVIVSSANVPSGDSAVGGDSPVVDVPTGTTVTPDPISVDVAEPPAFTDGSSDPLLDAGPAPIVDVAPPLTDDGGTVAAPQGPTVAAPSVPTTLGFLPASGAPRGDGALIYLVLVLGGAAVVVGQQVFSRFGVQLLMRA